MSRLIAAQGGLRSALVVILFTAATACGARGNGESPLHEEIIAEIGGTPVTRGAFEAYAAAILQGGEEGEAEAPTPETLSRLLDQFLEEEMVALEAAKKGFVISEKEVTEALHQLHGASEEPVAERPGASDTESRERMRRTLLARKFREGEILKGISVSPEEVSAYYDAHRDDFHQTARLVLRQIFVDDPKEAKSVREEVAADPKKFAAAAEAHSIAPDGGKPRAFEEADLLPEVVGALSGVAEGSVSAVVDQPECCRIFLVEKRQPERVVGMEEATDRIRVTLLQEKGRGAYTAFLKTLKEQVGLTIHEDKVPFTYKKRSA
jgi:hypothetical protein